MKINNYKELELRIAELSHLKSLEEYELKETFHQFVHSLNPILILKESLRNLTEDKTAQLDLAKAGLNIGANFIIDKTLGKYNSIKGFISSVLLENVSTSYIYNNSSKIISQIGKLFTKNAKAK
jgi:hypothetical protein